MMKIRVQYFSDVLCVWAYVAQVRVDELLSAHGPDIEMDYHFVDVFGDTPGRTARRWKDKGGLSGYGRHVIEVVEKFDHIKVHPEVWLRNVPNSSLSCHQFLYAVQETAGSTALARAAWKIRKAFFLEALDVSDKSLLMGIAESLSLSRIEIERHLCSGLAAARLSADLKLATEQGVTVSPTMVFDEGRQVLRGNVGYRVIEANVHELLERGYVQHSWC